MFSNFVFHITTTRSSLKIENERFHVQLSVCSSVVTVTQQAMILREVVRKKKPCTTLAMIFLVLYNDSKAFSNISFRMMDEPETCSNYE